jgi:hypothetical protein
MVAVLLIEPMRRIAKPGKQRCDRKGVFLPCTASCGTSLR